MAGKISREPLSFGNQQASGHEPLAGASPLAVNVVVDGAGAVHRRPGIELYQDLGYVSTEGPIVGLHSTAGGRLFAVDAPNPLSRVYEISGGKVHNLSVEVGSPVPFETRIRGGRRPILAETEAMLVISAGEIPQKVLLSTPAQSSPLKGEPPNATHIIAHQGRLLANNLEFKNQVAFSATAYGSSTAGHEDWTSLEAGDFPADARPDPIVALHENTNEVFAFGTTNLQIFAATGQKAPAEEFAVVNTREFGCSAPYSVVKFDQNFGFVDAHRRIVLTDGRDYQFISHDIQQTLDDIAVWDDVFGYRVTLGPVDALCWCSPTDGRTFAYQASSKSWSIWMGYRSSDPSGASFRRWPVWCSARVPETGEMLVGIESLGSDGTVAKLSNRAFRDGFTGPIVARVDTGFIDRGTSGRKLCRALRMSWRGTPTTDTEVFIQWRDDNGPWEPQRQVEIGYNSECILRSLGVYRRRQWRITFQSDSELVLARAEEEFELLAV